jgi:hypothetical protein
MREYHTTAAVQRDLGAPARDAVVAAAPAAAPLRNARCSTTDPTILLPVT